MNYPTVFVGDYEVRERLYYTREHEWIRLEGVFCRVGITDYAQKTLHQIAYVGLPQLQRDVAQNDSIGTIESVKSVSEIYSPLSGEVVERNEKLTNSPELVNDNSYGAGWIAVIKPSRLDDELKNLLTDGEYARFIEQLAKKK